MQNRNAAFIDIFHVQACYKAPKFNRLTLHLFIRIFNTTALLRAVSTNNSRCIQHIEVTPLLPTSATFAHSLSVITIYDRTRNNFSHFDGKIMSLASKVTFGLCCATSLTIIVYVHYQQQFDREQLHLGVIRDIELQQRRKAENLFLQVQQQELTRRLQEEVSKDHANS